MSKQSFNVERSLRLKPIDLTTLTGPKNGELAIDVNDSNKLKKYNEVTSAWEDTSPVEVTNYILNPNAQNNTFGWATYANTPGAAPISGTGGSPTVTLTRSTSAPLRGNASFLYTKPASNVQGQGYSYDFVIADEDKGKVLSASFAYQIASGTYADNDMSIWIYDITNARMIQGAPYLIKNSGIIEYFATEFQTSINSNSYRIIFHTASTSALAYTVKFDSFNISKQGKLYGSAVTDAVPVTYTLVNAGNATITGTLSSQGARGIYYGTITIGSTLPTGQIEVILPQRLKSTVNIFLEGTAVTNAGSGVRVGAISSISSGTRVGFFSDPSSTGGWGNTLPAAFSAGQVITFTFEAEIAGWSSSQVMSSDASTRVVAAASDSKLATGTLNSSFNLMKIPAGNIDTHGTYNPTTGGYTIPVPGTYDISCYFESSFAAGSDTAAVSIGIAKNGVALNLYGSNFVSRSTIGNVTVSRSALVPLLAGDVITFLSLSAAVSPTFSSSLTGSGFSIKLIQGPSQIMASETVACSYYNVAGTAIGAGIVTVPFPTKYFDTHNALNPATGVFTAPISGVYLIRTAITSEVLNLSTSQGFYSNIRRGGTDISSNTSWGNGVTKRQETQSSIMVPLLAGETISVVTSSNVATTLSTGSQSHNNISIVRVGNY